MEELNFEIELKKLNDIVKRIQSDELSLDDSLRLYEEGNTIIKKLNDALKGAEEKIEKIIESNK